MRKEGSDFVSKRLGQTWGFVRHGHGGAGTVERLLSNSHIPPSICHLMHNEDLVPHRYDVAFLYYSHRQGVTHMFFLTTKLPIVYITLRFKALCESRPRIIAGCSERTADAQCC